MANPTVISLERDYHDWNGTLPAVTFCYRDRLNQEAMEDFLEEKWNITSSDEDYEYFSGFIQAVVDISIDNLDIFDGFALQKRIKEVSFLEITQAVVPIIEQHIGSFDRSFQLDAVPIITEKGLCYSVNSPLAQQMFQMPQEDQIPVIKKPLSCKYTKNQCFMKIDVYGHRLSAVFVHSPFEIPLAETPSFAMERTDEITATYKIIETTADESLRELSLRQRKCLFHDEKLRMLSSYSLNLCTMECRASIALSVCGCKPFFYPFVEGPDCGINGMVCLNHFSWMQEAKEACECPKPCLDLLYMQNTFKIENWDVGEDAVPFAQKSTFRLEILPPRMRHRREILFTFEDLLVSLGAAASLFIGISFYNILHGFFAHFELMIDVICWCRARRS